MTAKGAAGGRIEAVYAAGALLALSFTGIFAYAWPLGFQLTAGVIFLAALPALARVRRVEWVLAPLVVLAALAYASQQWSPATPRAGAPAEAYTALKLIGLLLALTVAVAGACVLRARWAGRVLWLAGGALAAGLLVAVADAGAGAPFYAHLKALTGEPIRPDLAQKNIAQASYVGALLLYPLALALWRPGLKLVALLLGAATFLIAARLSADAAVLAMLTGGLAFLLVRRSGRVGLWAFGGVATAYWMATPWLLGLLNGGGFVAKLASKLPASWDARLGIWGFAAARVGEKPWLGWGLDASRSFGLAVPLHPHDAALQVWLELGVAGALLALLATWLCLDVLARVSHDDETGAAAGAAALAAYLTIGALSFGVWQEWWLCLGATAAVLSIAVVRLRAPELRGAHDGALQSVPARGG